MKRLHFASLVGLLMIGQAHGASSSSSSINYRGTLAQLVDKDYTQPQHANMPTGFSPLHSLYGNCNQPSGLEQTMKPLFSKIDRETIINAARNSQAYADYQPGKNIYDYYKWSGGFAALLGLGLWGMHKNDVLPVNWKHILLCAAVASAAGIYGSWDNSVANNSKKEAIINLRTNPDNMVYAVCKLAGGFTENWPPNIDDYLRCNPTPIYEGLINQRELGKAVTDDYKSHIHNYSKINAHLLPMRDLEDVEINTIKQVYIDAYNYLCNDLASDNKLGARLAAEEKRYTIPAVIPIATLAAGMVSGLGLLHDFRLSRI